MRLRSWKVLIVTLGIVDVVGAGEKLDLALLFFVSFWRDLDFGEGLLKYLLNLDYLFCYYLVSKGYFSPFEDLIMALFDCFFCLFKEKSETFELPCLKCKSFSFWEGKLTWLKLEFMSNTPTLLFLPSFSFIFMSL